MLQFYVIHLRGTFHIFKAVSVLKSIKKQQDKKCVEFFTEKKQI